MTGDGVVGWLCIVAVSRFPVQVYHDSEFC